MCYLKIVYYKLFKVNGFFSNHLKLLELNLLLINLLTSNLTIL